jgi:hypothetical protein
VNYILLASDHGLLAIVEKDSDEKSSDSKFRAASRAWRQIFHLPEAERLVNCMSSPTSSIASLDLFETECN